MSVNFYTISRASSSSRGRPQRAYPRIDSVWNFTKECTCRSYNSSPRLQYSYLVWCWQLINNHVTVQEMRIRVVCISQSIIYLHRDLNIIMCWLFQRIHTYQSVLEAYLFPSNDAYFGQTSTWPPKVSVVFDFFDKSNCSCKSSSCIMHIRLER